jgi:hypothetical protein
MKYLVLLAILAGCSYTSIKTHTEGEGKDTITEKQSINPTIDPNLKMSMIP